jgi:hypothetical protein
VTGPQRRTQEKQYSDALARLATALQRLDMTMTGLERLPAAAMYAIAAALDTVPDQVAVHQPKPPHGNKERKRSSSGS